MKKHISILGLCMSLLISLPSLGQLSGYGNGVTSKTWNSSNGIFYTDNTRAHVVSVSGTDVEIEGTHNFSNAFPYNTALIIQMIGGTQGKHEGVEICSTSTSGSNTILHLCTSLSGYSTGGSNRVQIILIPQYYDFTLKGGMVTCHPWDGKTGGVLCMMVKNDLTIDGGYFTVAGRGFYPEGVTWGTPGTGGGANTGYGSGGGVGLPGGDATGTPGYSPCNTPCISGTDVPNVQPGASGGNGSIAGTTKGLGSGNSGTGVTYGSSSLNTSVIMGNAGYYSPGTGAGDGGEGGGAGGGGGGSNSNPGADGQPGQAGANGGKPGEGARGGGIMYIKAGSYYNSTGGPVYFGNGGRGENGRPGENGGHGGDGGKGGLGECSGGSAHFSGGTGGSGIPGNGSEGGDGADGGYPGYLWLISSSGANPVVADVDISGGAGGEGGDGGYSFSTICQASEPMINNNCSLDLIWCPTGGTGGGGGGCPSVHSCDCDRAYELLSMATSSILYSPGVYAFENASGIVAYYDLNLGELTGFEMIGCQEFYYHCPVFSKAVCNEIFTNIINFETFIGAYTQSANVVNISPIEFGVVENNLISPADYEYYLEYNSDNEYLIDYTNPKGYMKCYNGACLAESYEATPYHINQGSKGSSGQSGYNGYSGGSSSNFPTSGTIGWKNGPSSVHQPVDQIGITLYPSPAETALKFGLSTESSESLEVSIYDLSGKLVQTLHFETTPGENEFTINVESLATGVYYFKAVMGAKSSALSFVKQ